MDIVVHGRAVEVPDHFRQHVAEKLERLGRYDSKLMNVDVELSHEKNRKGDDLSQKIERVEITVKTKGPVIRSEATAGDFYTALDDAATKLERRMRKGAERRRNHHGRNGDSVRDPQRQAEAVSAASAEIDGLLASYDAERGDKHESDEHLPGQIVRDKTHPSIPMTAQEAVEQLELVGHDFYLFTCAESGKPSVVYRRKAYDYGVIRLAEAGAAS
ncbi:ribosome hibernation-promoting factor, HPF/YfiA family [Cumulibacter manganitolerans]|uniref:ribosome hibernation-promoting factor, HPF/YfiA family n=1 Tax=Cumulibacter manganitolerans TaxID=1884992 RepID=UPI00129579D9|nr:ribosome-associated translation inhibitor RaiA [Cumulibacter manganitolerans]